MKFVPFARPQKTRYDFLQAWTHTKSGYWNLVLVKKKMSYLPLLMFYSFVCCAQVKRYKAKNWNRRFHGEQSVGMLPSTLHRFRLNFERLKLAIQWSILDKHNMTT